MPNITLPDGKKLAFKEKVSGLKVAEKISKSLAKEALVISVDGKLKDLSYEIEKDCEVKVLTSKDKDGLDTIRHDTAHILAMAVQELFPGTQVTIGPTIEDGFYYDFSRKEPFTEADLKKIETKMSEIVDRDEPTYREVWDRELFRTSKKLARTTSQKLFKIFLKMRRYQYTFMENGMTFVEVRIYHPLVKLVRILS